MVEFAKFKKESQIYLDEEKMYSNSNPIKPQRLMKDLRESCQETLSSLWMQGIAIHGGYIIFLSTNQEPTLWVLVLPQWDTPLPLL